MSHHFSQLTGNLYHILWDTMSDAVALTDENGIVIQANNAYSALYKCSLKDIVGNHICSVYPIHAQASAKARYDSLFSSASDGNKFNTTHTFADGMYAAELETHVYFEYENEKRIRMLSVVRERNLTDYSDTIRLLQAELLRSREEFQNLLHEQKRVEKELRSTEQKSTETQRLFEAIAHHFPNGTINVLNRDYELIFIDGQEFHRLGLNNSDFVGKKITEIFPADLASDLIRNYDVAFSGKSFRFEFTYLGFAYEKFGVPLPDDAGNINQILTVTLNITDRKFTERERLAQQEQLKAITSLVPGVIYEYFIYPKKIAVAYASGDVVNLAKQNGYTYLSPQCKEMFGWNAEDIIQDMNKFAALFIPEEFPMIFQAVLDSANNLKPFSLEFQIRKPSGELRWIQARSVPTQSSNSDYVAFNGVYVDITESKLSEQKLNEALKIADISTVEIDVIHRTLTFSDRHFEQLGTSFNKLGKRTISFDEIGRNAFTIEEDVPKLLYEFKKLEIALNSDSYVNQPFEYRIRRVDTGEIRTLYVFKVDLFNDNNGKIAKATAAIQDVTELKKLEREVVENRVRLQSCVDSTDDFICAIDRNYNITMLNKKVREDAKKYFNITPKIGDSIFKLVTPIEHWKSIYDRAFNGEVVKIQSGKEQYFENVINPVVNEDGVVSEVAIFTRDITDFRKLETQLRDLNESLEHQVALRTKELADSQERLNILAESTFEAILFSDNGIVVDVNHRLSELIGYTISEIIGKGVEEFVALESREQVRNMILSDSELPYEGYLIRKDGSKLPVEARGRRTTHLGKEVRVTVIRDMTERKKADEQLRISEAKLKSSIEFTPNVAIQWYDSEGRVLYWNHASELMYGWSSAEALGKTLDKLVYGEEDALLFQNLLKEIDRTHKPYGPYETQIRRRNGAIGTVLATAFAIPSENNSKIFVCMDVDITEQKSVEEKLKRSESMLEEAQSLAKIGSWEYDIISNKITWSKELFRIFERPFELGEPTPDEFMDYIHPDDRNLINKVMQKAILECHNIEVDYRIFLSNDREKNLRGIGSVVKNEAQKVVKIKGANLDITTQTQSEAEKVRLTERMLNSQKLEAIGTLASGIAHEFNNLLAIISLSAENIASSIPQPELQRQAKTISKTVDRGASIARQLLEFSRSEQSTKQAVNLFSIVLEVSSTLKRLLPKNISVLETFAQGDLFINGNEKQLYQVLLNLGINAGDAMPNGGELSFKLSVVDSSANEIERNRSVRIEVKDTGTGIPNEIQKRIFEPFFTTKGVGKGTGLGLSIVHGFITAHHGTIEVKSIPDSGTVFTISLPLIEAIQPIAEKSEIDLDIIKNATLLIVDDENSLRKPLAEILRSYGLTVIEAEDGKSALKIFGKKEHKFDLVLTDMGMPNMDGLELITRLRKIRRGIKTIVMTGYLDMKQTKTLEEQNISVISKPFETTALLTEIKRVLSMPEKAKRPNKIHKT